MLSKLYTPGPISTATGQKHPRANRCEIPYSQLNNPLLAFSESPRPLILSLACHKPLPISGGIQEALTWRFPVNTSSPHLENVIPWISMRAFQNRQNANKTINHKIYMTVAVVIHPKELHSINTIKSPFESFVSSRISSHGRAGISRKNPHARGRRMNVP